MRRSDALATMLRTLIASTFVLAACAGPGAPPAAQAGLVHFPIRTANAAAQRLFDEGLGWCYGFHHDEALRCFAAAAAADPACAMAQWGLAYAHGPHINNMAMTETAARQAHAAAQRARELAAGGPALEQALIAAIGTRYAWPAPAERKALDEAYAAAMRPVFAEFGANPDVAVLFAEALMDLRPWDLWTASGEPQPGTEEITTVLEGVLAASPSHPQACHLYIHAVEASRTPERAIAAAEHLRALPAAAGHLVHMPSHAFVRVGRYEEAAEANRRGIAADRQIVERTGRTGFYEVYRAHNHHFLAYAAMFAGRQDEAIAAARALVAELPLDVAAAMPQFLEAFYGAPFHALVRFGRWHEVLAEPEPPVWQKSARAMRHYARGIAFAALGQQAEAKAAERAFAAAVAEVPEDWFHGNNPTRTVLAIGEGFLRGEVAFRADDHDAAFAALRTAVQRSDALRYDEPWGWMMPPRHGLGALLLEAGRIDEAEQVYRDDLAVHPDNGWALHGLAECERRTGRPDAAAATMARFHAAWRTATVAIESSCFCRRDA